MGSNPLPTSTLGDADSPWILFLHGFLGSGSDWLPFAEELSGKYRCLMVDLPGHGEAPIPDNAALGSFFTDTLDALAELLRGCCGKPGFLAGYSMGGRIGLGLALRHPELFSAAAIISSSPGLKSQEERAARRKSDEGTARKIERNFEGFIEGWYGMPLFSTLKAHPLFREIESKRKGGDPHRLAMALRLLGTGNQPSFWEELAGSRVPMLFMAGQKDPKYVEIGRQMVNLPASSSLELFPDCGHTLHIEQREGFLERLHSFFNQHQAF